jgi:predicted transcriptional regulator
MTTTDVILRAISDKKSLDLFRAIAVTNGNGDVLISNTQITSKQYYSRTSRMIKLGLIKRKDGNYFLTTLGKVVYETVVSLDSALKNYWKLKAIDSIESNDLPDEEYIKIVNTLIDDTKTRDIILIPRVTRS